MSLTTTSSFQNGGSNAAQILYKKKALDFLRKELRFAKACVAGKMDSNSGKTVNYYRVDNLTATTDNLDTADLGAGSYLGNGNTGEGNYPVEDNITATYIEATLGVYGKWVKATDILEITERSDTMEQFSRQLGYNGGLSLDTVAYNSWLSGATAHYADNKDAGTFAADSVVTSKELRRLAKKFRKNSVRPNDDGFFHLFLHPDCEFDIITDDNFGSVMDIQKRNSEGDKNLEGGLVGVYGGFKVFTTPLITTTTSNTNGQTAYQNIATGYGAMLSMEYSKMPFNLFVNPSSNVNIANPLGRIGSIGWKASFVAKYIGSDGPRAYKLLATASEPTA